MRIPKYHYCYYFLYKLLDIFSIEYVTSTVYNSAYSDGLVWLMLLSHNILLVTLVSF